MATTDFDYTRAGITVNRCHMHLDHWLVQLRSGDGFMCFETHEAAHQFAIEQYLEIFDAGMVGVLVREEA